MDDYIVGRNAVREALRSGRAIQRLLVANENEQGSIKELITLARKQGVEVRKVAIKQLSKIANGLPHQGVAALVACIEFQDLGQVLQSLEIGKVPLLILTDGVEDPHNMGAIIRTAECIGATAVLIPKRHNAPINATVAKTSAGAIEFLPLV